MKEPRRFGLTERQFVWLLSTLALAVISALAIWAKASVTGFVALYILAGLIVGSLVVHRLIAGHWMDGSR